MKSRTDGTFAPAASRRKAEVDFIPTQGDVIHPEFYWTQEGADKEAQRIFERSWIFVGFTEDVAENGQFITAEIAGTSVVVQNFEGELRALHNVCTHRFARIQTGKCGKRPLVCPYHGWMYNGDGMPFIPRNAEFFQLDEQQRRARALRRFDLAACGRFLFIRISPEGPTLDEHLGQYAPVLRHLSEVFTDKIDDARKEWRANWKLGAESVLEVYHVATVHPETFRPFVQDRWEISSAGQHSSGTAYLSDGSKKWWSGARRHLKLRRSEMLTDYNHFFIFPSLALAVTDGSLLSVQTYLPLAPDSCELHYRLFLSASDLAAGKGAAVRASVVDNVTSFNRATLGEDQEIVENVQQGVRQMTFPQLPGRNEKRIRDFHHAWRLWMAAD